jgi:hypothetical protein
MSQHNFRQWACNTPEDLAPFIKYDRQRYLDFVAEFNRRVDALHPGEVLSVYTYPPVQYKLFVKLATMHVFISGMSSYRASHDFHFEMTDDYSGIRKIVDRTSRRKLQEDKPVITDNRLFRNDE